MNRESSPALVFLWTFDGLYAARMHCEALRSRPCSAAM